MHKQSEWDPTPVLSYPQWFITYDIAPFFFGTLAELFISGYLVSAFVAYLSSRSYRSDRPWLKALVWLPVLGNVFALYIITICCYRYYIWRNRTAAGWANTNEYRLWLMPSTVVSPPVQGFFAYRAATLYKKPWAKKLCLSLFGAVISLNFCVGVAFTAFWGRFQLPNRPNCEMFATIYCALAAGIDTAITLVLWILLRQQVLGHSAKTDRTVIRIARLALLSSLPTAFFAICAAVFEFLSGFYFDEFAVIGWFYDVSKAFITPLPAIYALALVYSLNARNRLRVSLRSGPSSDQDTTVGASTVGTSREVTEVPRTVTFANTVSGSTQCTAGQAGTGNTLGTQVSVPITVRTDSGSDGHASSGDLADASKLRSAEMVFLGDHKSTQDSGDCV